jgi:hypothetical protein
MARLDTCTFIRFSPVIWNASAWLGKPVYLSLSYWVATSTYRPVHFLKWTHNHVDNITFPFRGVRGIRGVRGRHFLIGSMRTVKNATIRHSRGCPNHFLAESWRRPFQYSGSDLELSGSDLASVMVSNNRWRPYQSGQWPDDHLHMFLEHLSVW